MTLELDRRRANYLSQGGRRDLTPRQRRRLDKKQAKLEQRPAGRR